MKASPYRLLSAHSHEGIVELSGNSDVQLVGGYIETVSCFLGNSNVSEQEVIHSIIHIPM